METIGKIRPAHFRNGRSIKGISRDLHVSRETVRKDLWASGYEGGYDAVRRYASRWAKDREVASPATEHVPRSFAPGEAYQFDWSHENAVIGASRYG